MPHSGNRRVVTISSPRMQSEGVFGPPQRDDLALLAGHRAVSEDPVAT